MENRRPTKNQQLVGTTKSSTIPCKKHPKHKQSPGVCSICLREKLCRLSTTSRSNTTTTAFTIIASSYSSSLSSLSSSSNASSYSSPVHRRSQSHHRFGFGTKGSLGFLKKEKDKNVLTKSLSVIFVREGEVVKDNGKKKKKTSFWSKLLRQRSKRMNEVTLIHSRTIR